VTAFPAHSGADRFPRRHADHAIAVNSTSLLADPEGALYWPEQGVLVVADLHLEKGSSFAARGVLLPPYDTAATLARITRRAVSSLWATASMTVTDRRGSPAATAKP